MATLPLGPGLGLPWLWPSRALLLSGLWLSVSSGSSPSLQSGTSGYTSRARVTEKKKKERDEHGRHKE
jgi:hypothetical protein